ncbi:MAG TPA: hypothetical protein VMW45_04560 [Dehalococcoidia bacterium]|nr:hypothetical protein [Dehalococcoidia bacterium]
MKQTPLEAYHEELREAAAFRDKEIAEAKRAYATAALKAWNKYDTAGGK